MITVQMLDLKFLVHCKQKKVAVPQSVSPVIILLNCTYTGTTIKMYVMSHHLALLLK